MIFKQAFRIAFVTFIWKQYKAWIVSTIILLTCILVIGEIHADLLQVWALNKHTSLTSSSLLYKWLAYIGCIAIYCFYHYFRPKKSKAVKNKENLNKIKKELSRLSGDEDPFNAIRSRDKLRSRSDFLLERKDKQE